MTDNKRIALVTGATRGLGLETARQLGQQGVTVLLGARNIEAGETQAALLRDDGLDVSVIRIDLKDEASISSAAEEIEQRHGRLDILVNNAGILLLEKDGFPSVADPVAMRETIEINFIATAIVTQKMLPLLRKSRAGRIVNVSSSLGSLWWNTDPNCPVPDNKWLGYCASKAAVNMLTVQLAYELRDTPIKVNAVCPGYVMTEMNQGGGYLSIEEGVRPAVEYALIGDDGPSGGFFTADGARAW
ncbi:SDR family oxidoreductase [Oceanicella sp. SM1341]|uniref:SDR family oxidoreductase n=1 Tax=Oceanicella sp. SM1341 TaxID=1548889 RepID=UPI000E4B21B4|nr:SDR family oxidoreductase [Oceanicella sp. SM1341]